MRRAIVFASLFLSMLFSANAATKYYKWETDYTNGGQTLVEQSYPTDADLTFEYTVADKAITNTSKMTSIENMNFVGLSSVAVSNSYDLSGGVKSVNFVGNRANVIVNNKTMGDIVDSKFWANSASGGTIKNGASRTIGNIIGSEFFGNIATNGGGGAINNGQHAKIGDIIDTDFHGNRTKTAGAGGAIYNDGDAKIGALKNVKFTGNYAGTYGGAIYNNKSADFIAEIGDMTDVVFTDNVAKAGGAIYNNGAILGSIGESTFTGNVANNGSGGAIYSTGTTGDIAADFTGNKATASGGAIYNNGTIGDVTGAFTNNSGGTYGGAIYNAGTIGNITGMFNSNSLHSSSSAVSGGAIYSNGGVMSGINADFTGNHINGKNSVFGGAIYVLGTQIEGGINGTFIDNHAVADVSYSAGGGAIYVDGRDAIITEIVGTFKNNYAKSETSYAANGGAIYLRDTNVDTPFNIKISGEFEDNWVQAEYKRNETSSGKITDYTVNGGAIYAGDISSLALAQAKFTSNHAISNNGRTMGGALYMAGGKLSVDDVVFDSNYARASNGDAFGGAVATTMKEIRDGSAYWGENHTTSFNKVKFTGNSLDVNGGSAFGGAVYLDGGDHSFTDTEFRDNVAKSSTGAAYGGALAIMGDTSVKFYGENNFAGNMTNDILSDIYNLGHMVVMDGVLSVDAGIAGDGDVMVNGGATLVSAGDTAVFENDVVMNGGALDVRGVMDMTGDLIITDKSSLLLASDAALNIAHDFDATNGLDINIAVAYGADDEIQTGLITVGGDVVGTSHIIVSADHDAGITDERIGKFLVAENDDLTTNSDFIVDRVTGNPYMWDALRNYGGETDDMGSHWYLVRRSFENPDDPNTPDNPDDPNGPGADDNPVYAPEVSAYDALARIAVEQTRRINAAVAGGLGIRGGAECNRYTGYCGNFYYGTEPVSALWINAQYVNANFDAPSDVSGNIWGLTVGADLWRDEYNWVGIMVDWHNGIYNVSGISKYHPSIMGARVRDTSFVGGAYYKYENDYGWRVNASAFAGAQNLKVTSDDDIAHAHINAAQYGAAASVAKYFALYDAFGLEPTIGLSWIGIDIDDFVDDMGKLGRYGFINFVSVDAGLRAEYGFSIGDTQHAIYVMPGIIQTITNSPDVRVADLAAIDGLYDETLGTFRAGLRVGTSSRVSGYLNSGYTFGRHYNGFDVGAGLRIRF